MSCPNPDQKNLPNTSTQEKLDALAQKVHSFQQQQEVALKRLERTYSDQKSSHLPTAPERNFSMNEKTDSPLTHSSDSVRLLRPATATHTEYTQKAFGQFLRKGAAAPEIKSLSGNNDPDGGFLVPTEVSSSIHERLNELSFFRQIAAITPVSVNDFEALVSTKNADVGWTDETSARIDTDGPQFTKVKIPAHEIYARLTITQRLIDDSSVDLESWINAHITRHMAQKETDAFLNGDGTNKPKGILSCIGVGADKISALTTGRNGGFKDDSGSDALLNLMGNLKTPYLQGACWIMSRSAEIAIRKLKDPNQMHFIWQAPQGNDTQAKLFGYPVYITDYMPALTAEKNRYSVLFGNFKEGYQITDRQDVNILRDQYSKKPFVEFYTTKRVGGDVINPDAIKALNFSA